MLIHCFVITPEPCKASRECRISAFVECSGPGQDDPANPGHFSGMCDDRFIGVHPSLKAIQPAPQSISCSLKMTKAGSCDMYEHFANVAISSLADAEKLLLSSGRVLARHQAQPSS